jgi:SAM-dependent methyltransferase
MRKIDRWLQRWRWRMAKPWIPRGGKVLDIGCHEGEFFNYLGDRIGHGVGLDPLAPNRQMPRFRLLSQWFTQSLDFPDRSFDAITLLATLEHIPDKRSLPRECHRLLRPGGRVILTVPSPHVDILVAWLRVLHLADGMSIEQHHDFRPAETFGLFLPSQFLLEHFERFQMGLNNLFVFRTCTESGFRIQNHCGNQGAPFVQTDEMKSKINRK